MKNYIKSIASLTIICIVIAALLAVTNSVTAPIIEKNQSAAANEALLIVMPNGGSFEAVDITAFELPATVNEAYSASNGGYVFKVTSTGYGADMVIMCGVDASGSVTGATCISSNETLGYEKTYGENTVGSTATTIDELATIAGATKTTQGYKDAVKAALNSAIILGGGSVDIRTPEQILADNLAAALPAGDTFESVFIAEDLTDVTAVYTALNGAGTVYVTTSGEEEIFVGVDASGNVSSDVAEEIKTKVAAAHALMSASSVSQIDISGYADMPVSVLAAYKTASGNYVLEMRAAGYGINGHYAASGEYIYLKASATADGRIISVVTTAQSETEGIGSACADPAFYTQFNGKTADDYSDIDAIGGATVTTSGYKMAISNLFKAVEVLKGGAR